MCSVRRSGGLPGGVETVVMQPWNGQIANVKITNVGSAMGKALSAVQIDFAVCGSGGRCTQKKCERVNEEGCEGSHGRNQLNQDGEGRGMFFVAIGLVTRWS